MRAKLNAFLLQPFPLNVDDFPESFLDRKNLPLRALCNFTMRLFRSESQSPTTSCESEVGDALESSENIHRDGKMTFASGSVMKSNSSFSRRSTVCKRAR